MRPPPAAGRRRPATIAVAALLLLGLPPAPSPAQTPKGVPEASLRTPAATYHGLVPGRSTAAEVRTALGAPLEEHRWYSWKMLYPAAGRPGHLDSVQLVEGKDSDLGCVEAASIPAGLETLEKVRAALGEPEWLLELHRQAIADYTSKGLRFAFDRSGGTIGVAYVPHGHPRVHSGERHFLSLRSLPQGPQPAPESPPPPDLRAGTASADITPRAEWLAPVLQDRPLKVHDPIRARCAVLARGPLKVAVVGADLFGMSREDVEEIEERVRAAGVGHLLLAMAHNHAAPDTIGIYGYYPKEYIRFIQDRIVEAVREASASLREVTRLVAASDELPLDGARVEGLFRNARNPGIVDPQVAVIQGRGADGKPIFTFVHFACHVEGLETGIREPSADFPGYLCDSLDAAIGGRTIFLNGALGGMVSGDTPARTHEEARAMGERLAREARRILGFAVEPRAARFSIERARIEVPLTNPRFALLQKLTGRRQLVEGRVVSELAHLRLGDADIITIPGELLPEVSFEVLERMDGYPRMIVGLVNDELGYMIPGYDFRAGEYEESMSVGPAIGPMVKDAAIRLLDSARQPGRFRVR